MPHSTSSRAALAFALAGACVLPACGDVDTPFGFEKPPATTPLVPAPGGMRRLLGRQYVGSIRVLFGDAAATAATPPADQPLHGFDSIGATELALSAKSVGELEASANAVASAAVTDTAKLGEYLTCSPTGPSDAACHRTFIGNAGRIAWRRDLDDEELDRITAIAQAAATTYESFDAGLAYAISALIQSFHFLYIVEVGEPSAEDPTMRKLTPIELLTRMSFVLLGHTPDRELLDEVGTQGLGDANGIRALAKTMLARPEAREALGGVYGEIFHFRDLTDPALVPKAPELFPNFTPTLRQALQEETLRLIDDIVWERDADFRELLTADYAFVNEELAFFYGMTPPKGDGFEKLPLPPGPGRAGFLGSGSFLARYGHATRTSPTRRGLFVRSFLMCEEIEPPPPGVNTQLPPDDPEAPKTMKEKLEKHRTDPSCKGCHGLMDPVGLSLEKFDGIGAFRSTDQGIPIDTDTDVPDIGHFSGPAELGALLAENEHIPKCTVRNMYRNALGHLEADGELAVLGELDEAFDLGGNRVQDLLIELCASRAFQFVGEPK